MTITVWGPGVEPAQQSGDQGWRRAESMQLGGRAASGKISRSEAIRRVGFAALEQHMGDIVAIANTVPVGVAGRHAIAAVVEDAAHQDGGGVIEAQLSRPGVLCEPSGLPMELGSIRARAIAKTPNSGSTTSPRRRRALTQRSMATMPPTKVSITARREFASLLFNIAHSVFVLALICPRSP
jgi:hypothetical protein